MKKVASGLALVGASSVPGRGPRDEECCWLQMVIWLRTEVCDLSVELVAVKLIQKQPKTLRSAYGKNTKAMGLSLFITLMIVPPPI